MSIDNLIVHIIRNLVMDRAVEKHNKHNLIIFYCLLQVLTTVLDIISYSLIKYQV